MPHQCRPGELALGRDGKLAAGVPAAMGSTVRRTTGRVEILSGTGGGAQVTGRRRLRMPNVKPVLVEQSVLALSLAHPLVRSRSRGWWT